MHAVVYDMNGREAEDAAPVLEALPDLDQYIFCSSAGVYLKNDQMPHREEDPTDQKSRHKVTVWSTFDLLCSLYPATARVGVDVDVDAAPWSL